MEKMTDKKWKNGKKQDSPKTCDKKYRNRKQKNRRQKTENKKKQKTEDRRQKVEDKTTKALTMQAGYRWSSWGCRWDTWSRRRSRTLCFSPWLLYFSPVVPTRRGRWCRARTDLWGQRVKGKRKLRAWSNPAIGQSKVPCWGTSSGGPPISRMRTMPSIRSPRSR